MESRFTLTQVLEKLANLAVENRNNSDYVQGILDAQKIVRFHLEVAEETDELLKQVKDRRKDD